MKTKNVIASSILASFMLSMGVTTIAANQDQIQAQDQIQQQTQSQVQEPVRNRDLDRIYGSQLMTLEERAEYRNNMRNIKSKKERETYRLEHHKKMQERAHERNGNLPNSPPNKGAGMGSGMGPGGGNRGGGR